MGSARVMRSAQPLRMKGRPDRDGSGRSTMNVIFALLAGLAAGAAGLLAGSLLGGVVLAPALGVSRAEGGHGLFAGMVGVLSGSTLR